jgi:choline dehydrogenase-like flavoprotein
LEYWHAREKLADTIMNLSKDGVHQNGTTRIADCPERGVVDRNLKLWGCKNVFVCSSSVFPTSSQANPTFLLGAFAARLADYLSQVNQYRNILTSPVPQPMMEVNEYSDAIQ